MPSFSAADRGHTARHYTRASRGLMDMKPRKKIICNPCFEKEIKLSKSRASIGMRSNVNAESRNTFGSHRCSCKTGFTGNGISCTGKQSKRLYLYQWMDLNLITDCHAWVLYMHRRLLVVILKLLNALPWVKIDSYLQFMYENKVLDMSCIDFRAAD